MSFPPGGDDMPGIEEYTDQELREMNQGCSEVTCPYHGAINFELMQRGAARR